MAFYRRRSEAWILACLYTRSQFCVDLVLGPVRRSFATYPTRRVDVEPARLMRPSAR
ncbi:hypothetical protein [Rhodococcus sp. LB1]|uniref:hypothetical protein n=1 Tax=Rhodococcus sp. LB1 TaxID=1807499 RepID=UPI0012E84624|nr:hypothetical protein [Rhodococcus sp. LB1]